MLFFGFATIISAIL